MQDCNEDAYCWYCDDEEVLARAQHLSDVGALHALRGRANLLAALLDLLLAGQEDEDVACRLRRADLDRRANCCGEVVRLGLRCVEDLDRVRPPRDLDQRRPGEVLLEPRLLYLKFRFEEEGV